MVPNIDEFNEVFESMVKGGSRWGHAAWDRVGPGDKPGRHMVGDTELEDVEARSREGRIELCLEGDS
jgi:hypothetical protein